MSYDEAIIDGQSIERILTGRVENFFLTEPSYYGRAFSEKERISHLNRAFSVTAELDDEASYLRWALSFCSSILEAYLLHDKLVVDQNSLDSILDFNGGRAEKLQLYESFEHMFCKENLSQKYGSVIAENVQNYVDHLDQHGVNSIFNFQVRPQEDLSGEKSLALMDGVMDDVSSSLFGNSLNSPLRCLFYHELSRESGRALILHPEKQNILEELQRALSSDRQVILDRLGIELSRELFDGTITLAIPPLSFAVVSKSYKEDKPLIEVASDMRDDKEIASIRKLISSLQLKEGQSRVAMYESLNSKVEEISKRIKYNSAYNLPFLSKKTLHISELPAISTILKFFGISKIDVPDLVLHEKGYVTFFEKWVNSSPQS